MAARRIAITGASGLIGRAATTAFLAAGHEVLPISRRPLPGGVQWDPAKGRIESTRLEGLDVVLNLAGESLDARRWTAESKADFQSSRIDSTTLIATTISALASPPKLLISASAMGYYGHRGDTPLDERAAPGLDFLAQLCLAWEAAADPARRAGIRVVHPRTGIVLTPAGGALARMLSPFRMGLGASLGDGQQWVSWVGVDDWVGAITHVIDHEALIGAVNVAAPVPVRNAEFTRELAAVLHRPALFRAPPFALRLLFGEMADAALLASTRMVPKQLMDSGYEFRHGELGGALRFLLGGGAA